MTQSIKNLYTIDEKRWRTYDIDKMSDEQAQVVAKTCPKEAIMERIKTGLLVGGFVVTLTASGIAASALSKLAAVFFSELASKVGLAFGISISQRMSFFSKGFGVSASLILCAYGIFQIWKQAISKISDSWAYANHLDQQAKDALLRSGYLAYLANMR